MKKLKILFLAIMFLVVSSTSSFAIETSKYLNTPKVSQQPNDQWCWAASSLSVLNYFLIGTGQCTFVSYVQTGTTNPQKCSNDPEFTSNVQNGLNYFGVSSTYSSASLTFSSTKTELNNNRPIVSTIYWLDSSNNIIGGHMVVIDGFYESTNYSIQTIRYMDPWDGRYKTMEYSTYNYNPYDRIWAETLYNVKKK